MSARDTSPHAPVTAVGRAAEDHLETRHQTERPPPRREGVISDPDQYFPDVPRPVTDPAGP